MDALNRAIQIVGGTANLAKSVGVVPSAVGNWKLRKQVPPLRCLAIEEATGGQVTRYELCPSVFGNQETLPQ